MEDVNVFWQPNPGPQTAALQSNCREILYGGARMCGKTECSLAWLSREVYHPLYRFLVIRKNSKDLHQWVDRAKGFYRPLNARFVGNPVEIHFPKGPKGIIGHLKDPNALDHYLGHQYHKILIEELTQIPSLEMYLKLISSCRKPKTKEHEGLPEQIMNTTNPGSRGHAWVKERFVDNGPYKKYVDPITGLTRIFIPATIKDNPFISDIQLAELQGLPEKLKQAWYYGNWDAFEGQYFSEWNSNIHVYEPFDIPIEWNRYISIDYGYSAPSAVLWFAYSPDGRIYQYRELYERGLTYESLRDKILSMSYCKDKNGNIVPEKIMWGVVDKALAGPSPGTSVYGLEVLNKDSRIKYFPSDSSKQYSNRVNGWGLLREYYKIRYDSNGDPYSMLNISRDCRNTIKTIPAMVHDESNPEDVDTDCEDHIGDAQRYFVVKRGPVATEIKKVKNHYKNLDSHTIQYRMRTQRVKNRNVEVYNNLDSDTQFY